MWDAMHKLLWARLRKGGFLPASATGALQELLPDLFCVCYSTHISDFKEAVGSPQVDFGDLGFSCLRHFYEMKEQNNFATHIDFI